MVRTAADIFKDKIRLVYEYNRKSPLFVHIADWEIENGNLRKSIEILNKGIEEYPDFPTAYLLLGKALMAAGESGNALKAFKQGSDLINSSGTYDYYLRKTELIEGDEFDKKIRTFTESEAEISLTPGEPAAGKKSVDERLEELAREISDAKIPSSSKNQPPGDYSLHDFSDDSMIVSETLAKIYISQGEYAEAIEVFEKLKKKNPGKVNYYSEKIAEVKRKIQDTPGT